MKALIAAALFGMAACPAAADTVSLRWVEGEGDATTLEALNAAYESTQPSAEMACLPLLYKRDWDGFIEATFWPCWWIQNSFGPTYALLPFMGEPYATWIEHSQALWFRLMGDGKRADRNGIVAPDGSLCDAAWAWMNGGSDLGFGDFRAPGGRVGQHLDGKISQQNVVYKQGDGNPRRHDFFIGTAAAGLILESERLLIRHDVAAARRRLPQLERVAAFLDSRRDEKANLLKGGVASNLLAPSYGGSLNPPGGQAYLTELSVNYIAGLERLSEVCLLCDEQAKSKRYLEIAAKVRDALARLMTPEGYFIMAEDPDGTRHGVFGAAKLGVFEATPNHDAGAFRVNDDASNRKIIAFMLNAVKGKAAPGSLAPHGLIIPNYPGYSAPHGGKGYGRWVNGGHWTTTQARMSIACLRADRFDHPFTAWAKIRRLMEAYRADAPLEGWGSKPWDDKLRYGYNVVYDCWGAPGGVLRGLFEYDYRHDRLLVRPHLPATLSRYVQKFPVWFGETRVYISVTGTGDGEWKEIRPSGKPGVMAVEIVRGRAKARGAWQPQSEEMPDFSKLVTGLSSAPAEGFTNSMWFGISPFTGTRSSAMADAPDGLAHVRRLVEFHRALGKAGLQNSYEAQAARIALELLMAGQARRQHVQALPELEGIKGCDPKAVEVFYFNTAYWMAGGLEDRLAGRALWQESASPAITELAKEHDLVAPPPSSELNQQLPDR